MTESAGFYIHIPFCIKKCTYCDFYSEEKKYDKDYIEKLKKNIIILSQKHNNIKVDTIFIGGGSPQKAGYESLKELIEIIKKNFCTELKEITVELNPVWLSDEFFKFLQKEKDFTRLSIGVQGFNKNTYNYIGRFYSELFLENLSKLFSLNKKYEISIDLITGVPEAFFYRTVDYFLKNKVYQNINHVSLYMLNLNSKMKKTLTGEQIDKVEKNSVSQFNFLSNKLINDLEFQRYEISNFAGKNSFCRHNLHYWNYDNYLSAGAGSVMKIEDKIFKYPNLTEYLECGYLLKKIQIIKNNPFEALIEKLMMRLRLARGVDLNNFKHENIDFNLIDSVKILYNKYRDYLIFKNKILKFNHNGFLNFNFIFSDFMNIIEKNTHKNFK
ncbi:MAG: radical SAM protein [Candidatus Muiribacteriota bacterium]